jgi:hypothetical protein
VQGAGCRPKRIRQNTNVKTEVKPPLGGLGVKKSAGHKKKTKDKSIKIKVFPLNKRKRTPL